MIKNYAALAFTAWFLSGCGRARAAEPEAFPFQGVIELEEVTLAFEAGGRIERVLVDEGDRVAHGAIVASLDDDLLEAERLARAHEAEAQRAQAALTDAGARREDVAALDARARAARATEQLLEKSLARERRLLEQSAVPQASVDQLEAELLRARAERESAEAQTASLRKGARREERAGATARADAADAQLALTDQRIARTVVRAPRAGTVLDVHVESGEVAAAGMPIVTLGDTLRPHVDVFVPQADLGGIAVGGKAQVRVDAEPAPLPARVEYIARELEFTPRFVFSERERAALVARVRLRIDDARERLHAGTPAFVSIARKQKPATPSPGASVP